MERRPDFWIFTSPRAVDAVGRVGELRYGTCVFVVGERTKELVRDKLGVREEDILGEASGNGAKLGEFVLEKLEGKDVKGVFACGRKKREELGRILERGGIELQEIVVYESAPKSKETIVEKFPDLVSSASIVLFSPIGAVAVLEALFSTPEKWEPSFHSIAIGPTTATALDAFTTKGMDLQVADKPTPECVMEQIAKKKA